MSDETLKKVKRAISESFGVKEDMVLASSNLEDDLGADSLDLVELVMSLEEYFEREIPDSAAENFKTVDDIVKYLDGDTTNDNGTVAAG